MTENQIQELFRLVTTLVNKSINIEEKINGLENRFDGLEKEVQEFRAETQENFKHYNREVKSLNVRETDRERKMAEICVDIKEITERVDALEEKQAA